MPPPHVLLLLLDDLGWANVPWHRQEETPEVHAPHLHSLVKDGIELDRHYVYKYCSPSRSALQSGRNPYHVNPLNAEPDILNPADPMSGFAGIPRNMTGIATKLASAGYRTHMVGKWDAGMATPDHTPRGRGYQSSLLYFHHCNDYWSMVDGASCPVKDGKDVAGKQAIVDLWSSRTFERNGNLTERMNVREGPAYGANNTCVRPAGCGHPGEIGQPDECEPGPKGDGWWGGYEDSLFEQRVLETIEQHPTEHPLFLFWAPHIVHAPLQVPKEYADRFDFMAPTDNARHARQVYHSMVAFADDMVANVTGALKRKGMWHQTLFIFSSDNGGPIYGNGSAGANNYPLKGGKMNNWEGGIRGSAFVSGGWLPPHVRGTKYAGLMALWDWYATLCSLAGVDATDYRAAAAGLPPIDSYDLSLVLLGWNSTSPRTELPLGTEPRVSNLSKAPLCRSYDLSTPLYDSRDGCATRLAQVTHESPALASRRLQYVEADQRCTTVSGLIVDEGEGGLWKILTGTVEQALYTGPHFPNSTTDMLSERFVQHCGDGCLYELRKDPFETHDLAAEMPARLTKLRAKLEAYEATAFNPHRGSSSPAACDAAVAKYRGFWGPFVP